MHMYLIFVWNIHQTELNMKVQSRVLFLLRFMNDVHHGNCGSPAGVTGPTLIQRGSSEKVQSEGTRDGIYEEW